MAIFVFNPTSAATPTLLPEGQDPSMLASDAGFTEELAAAMLPAGSVPNPSGKSTSDKPEEVEKKTPDLQILPAEVLMNAVGDANFALAGQANAVLAESSQATVDSGVQPEQTTQPQDTTSPNLTANLQGAELAAATLAAQMAANLAPASAATPSGGDSAVSAIDAQSNANANANVNANAAEATTTANAMAGDLQSGPVTTVDQTSQFRQSGPAGESTQGFNSTASSLPQNLAASNAQSAPFDAPSKLASTPAPAFGGLSDSQVIQASASISPFNSTSSSQAGTANSKAMSEGASQAAQQSGQALPLDSKVSNLETHLTDVPNSLNSSLAKQEASSATASFASSQVKPPLASQNLSSAAIPAQALAPEIRQVSSNTETWVDQTQASSVSAVSDLNADPSSAPLAARPAIATQVLEESAFKFDAKLSKANADAQPTGAQTAKLSNGAEQISTLTSGSGVSGFEAATAGLASTSEVGSTGSTTSSAALNAGVASQREALRASQEEAPLTAVQSLEDISSSFVSSLVGGPQRPVHTVMDWISAPSQERPAPVVPHEVRLDAGAVQLEIQKMVKQGGGHVVMELTPPDQSKFTIELKLDDKGGALLVVEGVSDSTRTRLEQSAPQLREQFQQMGLELQLDMRQQQQSTFSSASDFSGSQERSAGADSLNPQGTDRLGTLSTREAGVIRARTTGAHQVYLYA